MQVRFCRQLSGSFDGISLGAFRPGVTYRLGARIAKVFLEQGWAAPADDASLTPTVRPPPTDTSTLVLVVDDDADMRQLTATVLASSGYDVIEAVHGEHGLARLCHHIPDLVVLDLNMPIMDGWRFCAALQSLPNGPLASVPVLLLTGADGAHQHLTALKAIGLVQKPFEPDDLLRAVETALNGNSHSSRSGDRQDGASTARDRSSS